MVDESYAAKRMRGLNMILRSLDEIDQYNINHDDAKMLDIDKLTTEIMIEFSVKEQTARIWAKEATKMHEFNHEAALRQEKRIREEKHLL